MKETGIKLSASTFSKLKVNKLSLLKGIANLIKDISTGQFASIPADFFDTISTAKLQDDPGMIGWKLISRSLADALISLVAETNPVFDKEHIETGHLDDSLNEFLEKKEYFINSDFFDNPKSFALIDDIKPILNPFLALFSFNGHEISNILDRLNKYFISSVVNEWRNNQKYYETLKDIINTPFGAAEKKEGEWKTYSIFIEKEIHKSVFSESFSLAQIYIPLRAYYKVKKGKPHGDSMVLGRKNDDENVKRIVVDLETHLLDWVNKEKKNDGIRIIRGGPGYGKSSFLKMFAAKLTEQQRFLKKITIL